MKNFTRLSLAFILALTGFMSKSSAQCTLKVTPAVTYTCTGNGSDGIITFTVSNAALPYSFNFNSGGAVGGYTSGTVVESGLSASTGYSYAVTDANNCMVSGSVVVNKNTLPKARVTPSTTICAGTSGSYALGANSLPGNTYSWTSSPSGFSSNSSDPSISYPYFTTTYTLTETNPNGCSASNSVTISVNYPPSVSIGATENSTCAQGDPISLTGSPSGGTYSGNGVSGNTFSPSSAGVGNWPITYYYSDPNTGCSNSATTYISVTNIANLSLTSPYTSVCIDASNFKLTGTPGGGTYVGDGITDSTFDPTIAGPGTHVISYYYTQGTGCSYYASVTIMVHALPVVSFPNNKLCLNNGVFALNGTPSGSGGVYSGTGVSGQNFNPLTAGVGSNIITFVYTDQFGCSNSASDTITILPIPSVSLSSSVSSICLNGNSFTLSGGSPSGGTYSGNGVSSGIFNPANAGAGTQTIGYTVYGTNGCSNTATTNITVNPLPVISFSSQTVCIGTSTLTLNATPSGGTFSGSGLLGLVGNTLTLLTAGLGNHNITYTYTDGNGCTNSATATITIVAQPTVSISSMLTVCANGGTVSLSGYGSPSGGTFSGTGVSNNIFNPASVGAGTYTLTYTYTDGNGCTSSATGNITVKSPLTVSVSSFPTVCTNGGTISLSSYGSPSGGTFSGTGVSSNVFNPATSGAGTFTLTYNYTSGNGCSSSASGDITVNAAPTVSISTLPSVCVNGSTINLSSYGSPSGGTFSGTGVNSNVFNPATAGTGTYTLTYTFTNSNGCSGSATASIVVSAAPTVSISSLPSVCVNGNTVSLSNYGSPSGGTFSGTGVTSNVFNPATAGSGTYTLTYIYSNGSGCSNTATSNIIVNAAPTVSISSLPAVCANGSTISLSSYGSPSGGSFSGTGVSSNVFNPANAGAGTFSLTYTYSNSNGCANSASGNIVVNSAPTVSIGTLPSVCANGSTINLSNYGSPSGGTFSGTGVSNNVFNPATAGVGTYTLTYTYTGSNTCTGSATASITVTASPTVSVNSIPSVCINGNVVSLASYGSPSGGTFSGTGVTNNVFNPAAVGAGTFTLTYTYSNGNGCSSSANGTITVNALPTLSISPIPSACVNGNTISLSGYGSPSGGTFSGKGVTNNVFNPATAGLGTFTITYTYSNANGCTNSASTTITVNSGATASFSINDTEQCLSVNSFSFTDLSSAASGSISSWSWNFGDNSSSYSQNPTHSYTSAGNYSVTLTATAADGCSATATVVAIVDQQPSVSFTTKGSNCLSNNNISFTDASTIGSGSIAGWAWNFGDGVGTSSLQNPNYVYSSPGTYTVSLTVTTGKGCVGTYSSTVTIYPSPVASFSSNVSSECLSTTPISFTDGTVSSAKIASWAWSFGNSASSSSQNPTEVYATAGTYSVTMIVTTVNGCTDTARGQVVILPLPAANPGSAQTICAGSSVTLGSSAVLGSSYTWGNSAAGYSSPDTTVTPSSTTTYTLTETNENGCSASNSVTIKVNPLPAANAGTSQSICAGSSAGIGASMVTGSKYTWSSDPTGFSSSSSSASVTPSVSTTYTVTETNVNGCTASNSVIITVNPLPAALAGSNQSINSGSSATIGGAAVSGSTYSWSSNPSGFSSNVSNPTVSPTVTTTYTVTETNANGCKNSNSVTITVVSSSTITISVGGPTTFCSGGSVKLTANVGYGWGYSYQWSNQSGAISGATSQTYYATTSGTYYVTVTKSGSSSSSAGVAVTVIALPAANAGSNVSICYGSSATLGTSPVSGSTYNWTTSISSWSWWGWSTTTTSISTNSKITVSPTSTTTYTLTETNATGCSNSNTVTVTVVSAPNVSLSPFSNICASGSTFTLTGGNPSGGTYKIDGTTATSFNPANESIGSHTITYVYTNSTGCTGTASQTITVTTAVAAPTISVSGKTSFCSGGSVNLTASVGGSTSSSCGRNNNITFAWSNQNGPLLGKGYSSQTITVTTSGTYYVTETINGCSATSSGITISVSQPPVANAGSNVNYNYGYDTPPVLTGSANVSGATYKWSTGATTASITVYPTQTTTYWLTVTANGCTSQASYVTVYVLDVHCYNMQDKNRNNECVMCQYNSKTKQWSQVTVLKSNVSSCESNGDKFDNCGSAGSEIPGIGTDQMSIYPNPFTSSATVELTFVNEGQVSVELWSMQGKLIKNIFSGNVDSNTPYKYTIDGGSMLPGIYFVRVVTNDHANVGKIELLR